MKKLHLILIIILPLIFVGCDYWATHTYGVVNESNTVVIVKTAKAEELDYWTNDSIHVIQPNESKDIIEETGASCGPRQHPTSIYKDGDIVLGNGKFDIYVDGVFISELRLYQYWTFSSGKQKGRYDLFLTDELLEAIKNNTTSY